MSSSDSVKIWLELVSLMFLVIGGMILGIKGLINKNILKVISKYTFKRLKVVVYIIIGISALVHIVSRDYYLPFLGKAAYPCGSLVEKIPQNADTGITIQVDPNVNVIYWASEPNDRIQQNPWIAYQEYSNAGVVKSDERGFATLKVRNPSSYKIPNGKVNLPHIHYRVCKYAGMVGRIETVKLPH